MRLLPLLAATSLLTACSGINTTGGTEAHIMILADVSTPDELAYATLFTDGFARKVRHFDTLSIDTFTKDTTKVDYSGRADRSVVNEFLADRLKEVAPSTDKALVAAARRVAQYAHDMDDGTRLVAVILTNGSRDAATIDALTTIAETLPTSGNTSIYLAGVDPINVTALTPVFHTIPANAAVIGTLKSDVKILLQRL